MQVDRADAEHLVRRTGFGIDYAFVDELVTLNRSDAVGRVMDFSPNPAATPPAEVFDEDGSRWRQVRDLSQWWAERMRTVPRPLQEKLVLFWHGHFATNADTHRYAWQTWQENDLFRGMVFASFRDFAQTMSVTPSMLLYLDNYRNKAGRPNENFARELLELHLLGPGEHHSENDIIETARAWTGHHLENGLRTYHFDTYWHDHRSKTIFGINRNWDGPAVIDEAVLGTHRVTSARYIATQLWSFFAYPNPSSAIIDDLVVDYLNNNLNLGLLVRAIFMHDEFYSAKARTGLVRTPIEWTVACSRAANSPTSESRPDWWTGDMGQRLFHPPNPSGWDQNEVWISATGAWARADFASHLIWKMDQRNHLKELEDMSVPAAVDLLKGWFSLHLLTPGTRRALEDYLYAERAADEWPQYRNVLTLVMLSPEMQLA
ncbi:MAG: DUF1800 family protein [Actinomycetota bacterium]|jgi:uncharacterized protein (DUF1800 family)|nr:DUF1800 family protein [Actinomycetota bacterium]